MFSCLSSESQNKAQNIFRTHLKTIEDFVNFQSENINGETLNNSIEFLERLTDIKSSKSEDFDPMNLPSKDDLSKWENWFKHNKINIYWDKINNEVRIR